ncbi:hypothetical protein RvY_09374 [Ramazzottius varieornatus]|uniref:Small ribosomal subunit protein mS35 mitochondrial conserved domain-containing protein n=1 Tax=Ramazzottius varieornatus TaxID=947166 RepID=A0A1D1VBK6_RAMVA|nr:hypothetical protein RvY_09374 [Ramazzottius varieornatus]
MALAARLSLFSGTATSTTRQTDWIRLFASVPSNLRDEAITEATEFRTLSLNPARKERRKFEERSNRTPDLLPPRSQKMHVDQDWTNVWPTATSFKPSVVPLPVRMGFAYKGANPDKYGNAELMKIPNFLHLTPAAIKKHCAALKKFCTPWPEEIADDAACDRYFPAQVITSTYCHSGTSIRNSKYRIVSYKVPLSRLNLDSHARDKFLRLLGDRYDRHTDQITIITDRCPTRKQNYEYAKYLLTALFHESKKTEPWEHEKAVADFERFKWEGSPSEAAATNTVKEILTSSTASNEPTSEDISPEEVKQFEEVQEYQRAVSDMLNAGEHQDSVERYKDAVKTMLRLGRFS